ncbi:MAG: hypothetical protein L0229_31855 [Blastocatellia bacterium]|nr:hypothetical protein [Blastocatellia bacterium]
MKRLLATLTLILCLAFPVFAGHSQVDHIYGNCNDPENCTNSPTVQPGTEPGQTTDDAMLKLGILLAALLLLLKVKA